MNTPATKLLLSKISTTVGKGIDLFICSASFEARCLSVAANMKAGNVKKAFVCYNGDQIEVMASNKQHLMSLFGEAAIGVELMMNDPLHSADSLISAFVDLQKSGHKVNKCIVDITSFTHESLLILVRLLFIFLSKNIKDIRLIYTAASAYSINEKPENKWLTKGIGSVRTVLGYSGEFVPSLPSHLIILMGYETERALKLIDIFEPEKISLGLPSKEESISTMLFDINELKFSNMPTIAVENFKFSCIDHSKTLEDLNRHIEQHPGYNVVIATLNNKISTVGVAILALNKPEIQLCYASASQYNMNGYSIPDNHCYIFDLNLTQPALA